MAGARVELVPPATATVELAAILYTFVRLQSVAVKVNPDARGNDVTAVQKSALLLMLAPPPRRR